MRTTTACSWCHTMNDAEQRDCISCGHDAHVPRTQCRCSACTTTLPLGDSGHTITVVAVDSVRHRVATQRLRDRVTRAAEPMRAPPVDKIAHLAMGYDLRYLIYQNQPGYPGKYVLRCRNMLADAPVFTSVLPLAIGSDLGAVREKIPAGYVMQPGADGDLVELWR